MEKYDLEKVYTKPAVTKIFMELNRRSTHALDLSRRVKCTNCHVGTILKAMKSEGYLRDYPRLDKLDTRRKVLVLTLKGKKVAESLKELLGLIKGK